MNRIYDAFALGLAAFVVLVLATPLQAGQCLGDSLHYRILSYEVGYPNVKSITPVQMPCDTMVVEEGRITEIFPGTLLHFGDDAHFDCVLQVRGQLVAKGTPTRPIYLAGNSVKTSVGVVHGKAKWGGLQIDSLGSLNFRHVRTMNASTAITFLGKESQLDSVFFSGCFGLILPGGRNYALDPQGSFYPEFDILRPPRKSSPLPIFTVASPVASKKDSAAHAPLWAWGAAAGVFLAGGAGAYVWWENQDGGLAPTTDKPGPGESFQSLPPTPGSLPRK